ncbi:MULTISPECIES: hypothetical protein [unclassified Chelatococcus]|uniref:hypothetical protein n=1 Tax=unclassified Chelatococcus TaxID=2638111 RepID=UPI001BCE9140|nr:MULTISPECIES: hypothetical protein [unclassified Chelatococcus]MBS7695733.1 hypothetical protein [Chelatococcus sp. YT9]MBX3557874.1 hypothetical protein [Chelatococcus sp.]
MYRVRTPGYKKNDPIKRWALPDRVFFACGACHILAYAFLERYSRPDMAAVWLKPDAGYTGNHIVIATADWIFDYHGYARRDAFLAHTFRRARHFWPGWDARLVTLPQGVLISEAQSRAYEGLWLREPQQFLHDALPRARRYLTRFAPPPAPASPLSA